jgi:hypothetical protein
MVHDVTYEALKLITRPKMCVKFYLYNSKLRSQVNCQLTALVVEWRGEHRNAGLKPWTVLASREETRTEIVISRIMSSVKIAALNFRWEILM